MTEGRPTSTGIVRTVAAVIRDRRGRMLLVRKRGREAFIQPGGKPEPGESELQALARELDEELGCRLQPGSARHLGCFSAPAVHEPGWHVQASVYTVRVDGTPAAGAEIDEVRWVEVPPPDDLPIAPLSRGRVFPLLSPSRRD